MLLKIIFAVAGVLMILVLVCENINWVQKSPSSVFTEIGSPLYEPFDIEKECLKLQEEREKQEPYLITLWWGFDGLRLNADGSTEWISRRKPDTSLQSIVQRAFESENQAFQIKMLENRLKEVQERTRFSTIPKEALDSLQSESGIITAKKQEESGLQSTVEIIYRGETQYVQIKDLGKKLKEFEGKRIEAFYIDFSHDIDNTPNEYMELKKLGGYYIYDNEPKSILEKINEAIEEARQSDSAEMHDMYHLAALYKLKFAYEQQEIAD